MITESNHMAVLYQYFIDKYGDRIQEFYERCKKEIPLPLSTDAEMRTQSFIEWFVIAHKIKETGKTVAEEFVNEHPEIDIEMKTNLLNTNKIISSKFIVLSINAKIMKCKDTQSSTVYDVSSEDVLNTVKANSAIIGNIHPFGDKYILGTVFRIYNSPMILDPQILVEAIFSDKIRDAENIIITENTTLTAALNKYPSNWVDGICKSYSMNASGKKNEKAKVITDQVLHNMRTILAKLPEKSRAALTIILKNEGIVKYAVLKQYDDDISYFWGDEPPTSTIGVLRLKGLLIIGKLRSASRSYKAAVIPKDVREKMRLELEQNSQLGTHL